MSKPRSESFDLKTTSTKQSRSTRRGGYAAATRHRSRSAPKLPAPRLPAPNLPAPGQTDQEAEAERDAHGCQWPLRDGLFQRLPDRGRGVLGGIHHGAATLRHIVDRLLRIA